MDKKKSLKKAVSDESQPLNKEKNIATPTTGVESPNLSEKNELLVKATIKKSRVKAIKPVVKLESEVLTETERIASKPIKTAKAKTNPILKKANISLQEAKPQQEKKSLFKKVNAASTQLPEAVSLTRITFQVKYSTTVGQSLYVVGNHELLGGENPEKAFPLDYLNNEYWLGSLDIPAGEIIPDKVVYNYLLKNSDGTSITDWGNDKTISPSEYDNAEVVFLDTWNDASIIENTFYSEPFKEVLLKDNFTAISENLPKKATHIFRAKAPLLPKGHALCISGSCVQMGEWNTQTSILLASEHGETWHSVSLDLSEADFPIAYKYGIFDVENGRFAAFENGNNRVLYDGYASEKLTVVSDGFTNISYPAFKGAGVAIPVFSLRSAASFGVGEFADLKLLIDWAKKTGLKLIQLLPVNDTTATHTYTDSYPYAAISAFALHPLYLHLPAIVNKENTGLLASLKEKQTELNAKPEVDYVGVMAAKWEVIKKIFPSQKQQTFKSGDFNIFFTENAHWLVPYAAFSCFREKYNTADFNAWPQHSQYSQQEISELAKDLLIADEALSIYFFVQYHLHLQLKDAANYAHQNGVIVKGDIPIGIYRNSCDAWQDPELYNMNKQAGAPPDDFAVKGQNWGFPTYNWQRMKEDGFEWWKKRFKQMSYYFDAFRIDHILGFFRIWSIPLDAVEGILGYFVPAIPVHINEFHSRGIFFDYKRYCRPFITTNVLYNIFGNETEAVKSEFLTQEYDNQFLLKPAFNTQRKVEFYFDSREESDDNKKIKSGLFELISNVILLEEAGSNGQQFHFRIGMASTVSFQYLDGGTQQQLRELYLNYFYNRQDEFWRKEAMQKLPELKRSTNMLVCGEDLGMVPASVAGVMHDLAILSLEIQRMPKDAKREFFHPNDAPYLSVVTPSTHDMSTIRGWWEEDRNATQRFFNYELGQWGTAPLFCEPWINRIILMQHFYSPAMWSIFQLQDLLGISQSLRRENPNDERINIPADPKHYWRYRMHLSLETLFSEDEFNNEIKSYVIQSGR